MCKRRTFSVDSSLFVSILISEKRIVRYLCHLPVARGQQTVNDTVQDRGEGLQERLHVRVAHYLQVLLKLTTLRG